ncbi:MAG: LysR family transcriptional regulator [Oscillibacter sp.]|nr:LysR family transcriptional regulator [Oscillibacter sp.]
MNLQQFKYVLEAYRQNSISRAAAALYVTQPTLSIAIKELESELGFTIFERTSKGIIPTPAGTAFIHSISGVLMELEQIRVQYSSSDPSEAVTMLRISTCRYTFVTSVFLRFYRERVSRIDKYAITVTEQDTQECIQDVLQKKSDIGIIHTNSRSNAAQLAYFSEKKINFTKLFETKPYVLFRKGHPLETMEHITEQDLMRFPQIRGNSHNMDFYQEAASFSFLHYTNNHKNIFLTSMALLYSLLPNSDAVFLGVSDKGVLNLYPGLSTKCLDSGDMMYFYAITHASNPLSEVAQCFLETLQDEIQGSLS